MKKFLFILALLLLPSFVSAEDVQLKSGVVKSGEIVEKTDSDITLKDGDNTVTIPFDMISAGQVEALKALPNKAAVITPAVVPPSEPPPVVAPSEIPSAVAPSEVPPAVTPSETPPVVAPSELPPVVAPSETPQAVVPSEALPTVPQEAPAVVENAVPGVGEPVAAPVSDPVVAAVEPQPVPAEAVAAPTVVPVDPAPVINAQNEIPSQGTTGGPAAGQGQKAQGMIQGRPFTVERAEFKNNILELRQGSEFFPDLGVTLFLFSPEGPSWENSEIHVTPQTTGSHPHIHKKWRVEGKDIPETKIYMSNYTLDLTLGEVRDGKIQGTINLRLPDEDGSHIEGTFEAEATVQSRVQSQGAQETRVTANSTRESNAGTMTFERSRGKTATQAALAGLGGLILAMCLIYLLACLIFAPLCLQRISQRLNKGVSWHAWIPIVQLFLMCELAGLRPMWLWLLLAGAIPVVGVLAVFGLFCYIWYKIAIALNKPGWMGVLTFIPVVNFVIMGYLAFSEK